MQDDEYEEEIGVAETNIPQGWEGQQVVFRLDIHDRDGERGVLQAVSALGLTIREETALAWAPYDGDGDPPPIPWRVVPVFYPPLASRPVRAPRRGRREAAGRSRSIRGEGPRARYEGCTGPADGPVPVMRTEDAPRSFPCCSPGLAGLNHY